MSFLLRAGTVYTPTRRVDQAIIEVREGVVESVGTAGPGVVPDYDYPDCIVIPGLLDLQVNGALGYSFGAQHVDHFSEIVDYHRSAGTYAFLPTLVTAPEQSLLESLQAVSRFIREEAGFLPGIHLEGPFLSPEKSGAHDPSALRTPDGELAVRFLEAAGGALRILTVAPELPGALDLISEVSKHGVIVSAGHSAASYQHLQEAMRAGLRMVTHAGNASDWPHRAMGSLGFLASEPGLVGTLMAVDELAGSVIMDGFHFHPALLKPLLKLKGPDRLLLVSDASTIAGCPPGEYSSGGIQAAVHPEGFATSGRGGGWLAGSTITLLDAVRRAVHLAGISLQDAVHMASLGPARLLEISNRIGHLEPGAEANLVVLNQDLSVRKIIFQD